MPQTWITVRCYCFGASMVMSEIPCFVSKAPSANTSYLKGKRHISLQGLGVDMRLRRAISVHRGEVRQEVAATWGTKHHVDSPQIVFL